MGLFDRWNSQKGKADKAAPKRKGDAAEEAKKHAFASVPSGKTEVAKTEPKAEAKGESKKDSKKSAAPKSNAKEATDRAYQNLLRPIVTEKTSRQPGQYTFEVPMSATKMDVKNAVQQVYGIRPEAVNIIRQLGKQMRYGYHYGKTIDRKKAIVTLPSGKTIDLVNG